MISQRAPALGVLSALLAGALALLLAPLALGPSYDWTIHTTSESAAQATSGAWVARTGFVAFAVAVGALVLRPTWELAARVFHSVFAICMVGVSIYSSKSWDPLVPFDATEDLLHSIAATVMGFAFAAGVVSVLVRRTSDWRDGAFDVLAVVASVTIPLAMTVNGWPHGLLQRAMFGIAMVWYGREALHRSRPIDPEDHGPYPASDTLATLKP